MKRLKESIWAKIAAWLLLSVFIVCAIVNAAVIFAAAEFYFYDTDAGSIDDIPVLVTDSSNDVPGGYTYNPYDDYLYYYNQPEYRDLVNTVFENRYNAILNLAVSAVLALIVLIFLMSAAGHEKEYEGIHLTWFDKIPLDFFLIAQLCLGVFPAVGVDEAMWTLRTPYWATKQEYIFCAALFAACLTCIVLFVCIFFVTLAARVKAGTWIKNTLTYKIISPIFRFIKRILIWMLDALRAIPIVGKAALCGVVYFGFLLILSFWASADGLPEVVVFFCFPIMLFGFCVFVLCAWQMKRLQAAAERLAHGNLSEKVSTEKLFWDFKVHAENLNAISDGINTAVNERMRSERLKTELITNVSHDIKTPLTSIINYIDLMQHTEEEKQREEYLEVLSRQSVRLKKLMEDLIEASRASTGSIAVNLEPTAAGEIINQSLAEYNERLANAGITPIVTMPEESVELMADGKLLWRVMDNILSNVCKYALSGTRMYIDLIEREDGMAEIMVKNISGTRLNISAEELMERFVRGDASRSTQGSGLGLNIAKSLCELMGGSFSITVDGDLFKSVVVIPLLPMEL